MRTLQSVVSLLAKIIAGAALIYGLLSLPKLREEWKNYLKAAVPLIVFAAYAAGIYLVTNIRGFTEFDAMPNYYMGDTIYEFMRHPFTYFFCGMLVLKGKWRKVLIIIFELSAMIMNVASMIDKWVVSNSCFTGLKGSAIFNNTNHYGYYLAIAVICAALLFIYESGVQDVSCGQYGSWNGGYDIDRFARTLCSGNIHADIFCRLLFQMRKKKVKVGNYCSGYHHCYQPDDVYACRIVGVKYDKNGIRSRQYHLGSVRK